MHELILIMEGIVMIHTDIICTTNFIIYVYVFVGGRVLYHANKERKRVIVGNTKGSNSVTKDNK